MSYVPHEITVGGDVAEVPQQLLGLFPSHLSTRKADDRALPRSDVRRST